MTRLFEHQPLLVTQNGEPRLLHNRSTHLIRWCAAFVSLKRIQARLQTDAASSFFFVHSQPETS